MCVILPRNTEVLKRNISLIQPSINLLLQGEGKQGIGGEERVHGGETGECFMKRGPVPFQKTAEDVAVPGSYSEDSAEVIPLSAGPRKRKNKMC